MYLTEETWNKLKELKQPLELSSTNKVIEHIIESYLNKENTVPTKETIVTNLKLRQSVFQ